MKCPNCGAYIDKSVERCEYCAAPNEFYVPPQKEKAESAKEEGYAGSIQQQAPSKVPEQVVVYMHPPMQKPAVSEKNRMLLLLLAIFFGWIGLHRFYQGKNKSGLLYLFTCGIGFIGWVVDVLIVILGNPKDSNGLPIVW